MLLLSQQWEVCRGSRARSQKGALCINQLNFGRPALTRVCPCDRLAPTKTRPSLKPTNKHHQAHQVDHNFTLSAQSSHKPVFSLVLYIYINSHSSTENKESTVNTKNNAYHKQGNIYVWFRISGERFPSHPSQTSEKIITYVSCRWPFTIEPHTIDAPGELRCVLWTMFGLSREWPLTNEWRLLF